MYITIKMTHKDYVHIYKRSLEYFRSHVAKMYSSVPWKEREAVMKQLEKLESQNKLKSVIDDCVMASIYVEIATLRYNETDNLVSPETVLDNLSNYEVYFSQHPIKMEDKSEYCLLFLNSGECPKEEFLA